MANGDVRVRSDAELGGRRTVSRHVAETGAVGQLASLLVSFMSIGSEAGDMLTPWQATALVGVLTAGFGGAAKLWHEAGMTGRLLRKAGLGMIAVVLVVSGCGIQLGKVTPHDFSGSAPGGEVVIACEVTGVSIAIGDAGVCQNVEGGHVSQAFSALFGNTVGAALNLVGAFFGRAPVAQPAAVVAPHDHPPAIVVEPAPAPSSGGALPDPW